MLLYLAPLYFVFSINILQDQLDLFEQKMLHPNEALLLHLVLKDQYIKFKPVILITIKIRICF
jgi:hypothetical protein